jgi:hypothetical protein
MKRFLTALLSTLVLFPAVALSEISDEEYCKFKILEPRGLGLKSLKSLRFVGKSHEFTIKDFDSCVTSSPSYLDKEYVEKKRAMVLNDGGYATGGIKVCKKIKYFKLRRPTESQCWDLPAGTNVTIKKIGLYVPIKISLWSTVYGAARICYRDDEYFCIQSHKIIY